MTTEGPRFFTTSILPVRRSLVLAKGGRELVPLRVRVGYFHHPALGHTLIDTGYSRHVVDPHGAGPGRRDRLLSVYRLLLRPTLVAPAPLGLGLARLGLRPGDIDTVIVTHFHADHIGGLMDLPRARIVCSKAAWEHLTGSGTLANAVHGVFTSLLPDDLEARVAFVEDMGRSEAWGGRDLAGDGSVVSIDVSGHLAGQIGLLFPALDPPLVYGADVQFCRQAVEEGRAPGPPASLVAHDRAAARRSTARVRDLMERGFDALMCHDWNLHPRDIDPDIGTSTSTSVRIGESGAGG